ncbi:MAG: hypothetical protein ACREIA_22515 [Opitutaceae bacterium]
MGASAFDVRGDGHLVAGPVEQFHGLDADRGAWLAWRAFETRPGGRFRFAHTAAWHLPITGAPLRPGREEIGWLIQCVEEEIARRESVLPAHAITEYKEALAAYRRIAERADGRP